MYGSNAAASGRRGGGELHSCDGRRAANSADLEAGGSRAVVKLAAGTVELLDLTAGRQRLGAVGEWRRQRCGGTDSNRPRRGGSDQRRAVAEEASWFLELAMARAVVGRRHAGGRQAGRRKMEAVPAASFTSHVGGDVYLHLEVLYFTSPGGRNVILFASKSSVGQGFWGFRDVKVSYFFIYIIYFRCS